jgi:hypothetical protein
MASGPLEQSGRVTPAWAGKSPEELADDAAYAAANRAADPAAAAAPPASAGTAFVGATAQGSTRPVAPASAAEAEQQLVDAGVDPELAQLVAQLSAGDALGMPAGYEAPTTWFDAHPGSQQQGPLRYTEADILRPFGQSTEAVTTLQKRLAKAGLLTADYQNGFWDTPSQQAYGQLLAYSNQRGVPWHQTLIDVTNAAQETRRRLREQFRPSQGYLRPDRATVNSTIRDAFRGTLGRLPQRDEIREFAQRFLADDRAAYESQVAAERTNYMQQVDAQMGAVDPNAPVVPMEVADVDPAARFEQYLLERRAGEIRQAEDVAHDTATRVGLQGSFSQMMSLLHGAG